MNWNQDQAALKPFPNASSPKPLALTLSKPCSIARLRNYKQPSRASKSKLTRLVQAYRK